MREREKNSNPKVSESSLSVKLYEDDHKKVADKARKRGGEVSAAVIVREIVREHHQKGAQPSEEKRLMLELVNRLSDLERLTTAIKDALPERPAGEQGEAGFALAEWLMSVNMTLNFLLTHIVLMSEELFLQRALFCNLSREQLMLKDVLMRFLIDPKAHEIFGADGAENVPVPEHLPRMKNGEVLHKILELENEAAQEQLAEDYDLHQRQVADRQRDALAKVGRDLAEELKKLNQWRRESIAGDLPEASSGEAQSETTMATPVRFPAGVMADEKGGVESRATAAKPGADGAPEATAINVVPTPSENSKAGEIDRADEDDEP